MEAIEFIASSDSVNIKKKNEMIANSQNIFKNQVQDFKRKWAPIALFYRLIISRVGMNVWCWQYIDISILFSASLLHTFYIDLRILVDNTKKYRIQKYSIIVHFDIWHLIKKYMFLLRFNVFLPTYCVVMIFPITITSCLLNMLSKAVEHFE